MSTRCNVVVKGGNQNEKAQQLYHHCDGYPTNLLGRILEGRKIGLTQPTWAKGNPDPLYGVQPWQLGRVGKVASFLCAADPGQFEPEEPGLHSDIEYFYEVDLITEKLVTKRKQEAPTAHTVRLEIPAWMVTVYIPNNGKFWDVPTMENLKRVAGPMPIEEAVERAEEIECGKNFSRCSHYAYKHFPELEGTPMGLLGMAAYLGKRPLEFRDAIAYIYKGVRYETTGCGWSGNFGGAGIPGVWTAVTKGPDGEEKNLPVAHITNTKKGSVYHPYGDVKWVLPPTKNNPNETMVSA